MKYAAAGPSLKSKTNLLLRSAQALPSGLVFVAAESYGESAWSVTAKLTTKKSDGESVYFFLKVRSGQQAWRISFELIAMFSVYLGSWAGRCSRPNFKAC